MFCITSKYSQEAGTWTPGTVKANFFVTRLARNVVTPTDVEIVSVNSS